MRSPCELDTGFPVYPINPKIVDRRRKPSGAKTDAIDAYLLAKTGRSDLQDLYRLTPDNPIVVQNRTTKNILPYRPYTWT